MTLEQLIEEAREKFEKMLDNEIDEAGECGITNILDYFDEVFKESFTQVFHAGEVKGLERAKEILPTIFVIGNERTAGWDDYQKGTIAAIDKELEAARQVDKEKEV